MLKKIKKFFSKKDFYLYQKLSEEMIRIILNDIHYFPNAYYEKPLCILKNMLDESAKLDTKDYFNNIISLVQWHFQSKQIYEIKISSKNFYLATKDY